MGRASRTHRHFWSYASARRTRWGGTGGGRRVLRDRVFRGERALRLIIVPGAGDRGPAAGARVRPGRSSGSTDRVFVQLVDRVASGARAGSRAGTKVAEGSDRIRASARRFDVQI